MSKILIIEDDASFCQMLQKFLMRYKYEVEIAFNAQEAKLKLKKNTFDLVLTDLRLPNYNGIKLLEEIKEILPKIPVIVMTGYAEVNTAVTAMKKGAYDYISKPFTPEEIVLLITDALKNISFNNTEKKILITEQQQPEFSSQIKGESIISRKVNEYIALVAPTNMSVLIMGESGTGKEVTAKAIHNASKRKDFNFIAVDCGAIPKEIATSEFFGHTKGSFTGAIEDKMGHFEAAHQGTLFLDEIGNLSYENQIQLLRAIQERKIKRIGSNRELEVDVRILTATNENLLIAIEGGKFREDLYHRINEFFIEVPSLKERGEDLILFTTYFLNKANSSLGKNVQGFTDEVQKAFEVYDWPGNLRELQNVIKRAVLLTSEEYVTIDVLPREIIGYDDKTEDFSKDDYEKNQIIKALKKTNFNKSKAAKLLRITRKTLYNKINYYKLDL